jgi:hypothetical protein
VYYVTSTLQNFGVPLGGGAGRGGIIQPKVKHKFRVRVINFGPVAGGIELSQQVVSVGRPQAQHASQAVHSFNSIGYYAGKAEWSAISLIVRDDVTNSIQRLVGHQEQKQMNHFQQTSALAGSNYKFQMFIETLDGGDDVVLESWFLEGCFLESIEWDTFDYSSSDAMQITMSIRYDNAHLEGGLMPINPDIGTGPLLG